MTLKHYMIGYTRACLLLALMSVPLSAFAQKGSIVQAFELNHLLAYLIAGLSIGFFVLLFYNRLYIFREQDAKSRIESQNERLSLVLQTGNLRLWLYDVSSRHYIMLSESGSYANEYNPVEFSQFFHRDDFDSLREAIFDICEDKRQSATVHLRSTAQDGGTFHYYEFNLSVVGRDGKDNVERLLCIQRDVTEEERKKQSVNELLMRYHTVFNSSLIDMMFFDKDGYLHDVNDRACQSFGVSDKAQVLSERHTIMDHPAFEYISLDHLEDTRSTSIVDFSQLSDERLRQAGFKLQGKVYYESTVNPIRNKNGELEGIYMAGRSVTEMVQSYHRQQEGIRQLRQATKNVREYINNINYALRVSDVRLVSYNPSVFTLEVSSNIDETQLRLSQLRCIRLGTPRFRRHISSALNRMDHRTEHTIELTVETEIHDKKGRPIWLWFNLIPLRDKEGRVERYFGLCRNMTDQVETEQRLAVETKKAQEAEILKQSFLTNMSYEIRTPLNTVVGFAELFETEHDEADEPIFVEEIKRNSNSLLMLVNDILYLSRLDAHMIEYNRDWNDFALLFESYCQMGWSGVAPHIKTLVENPYEHLELFIDHEHLGKVIEKLCANAVNYTPQGYIRGKYEYRHGELIICIEDTGNGIDQGSLPHVFERFTRNGEEEHHGTGLDLPIVKELMEQMGGTVEVQSQLGKGTAIWLSLPCESRLSEKRRDIV